MASVIRIRFLLIFGAAISSRFIIIRNEFCFVKAIWLDFWSNFAFLFCCPFQRLFRKTLFRAQGLLYGLGVGMSRRFGQVSGKGATSPLTNIKNNAVDYFLFHDSPIMGTDPTQERGDG